jgi:hypothetical protein
MSAEFPVWPEIQRLLRNWETYVAALLQSGFRSRFTKRLFTHPASMAVCATTAGHSRIPDSPRQIEASTRRSATDALYTSMARTNPDAARLNASPMHTPFAIPKANRAAPAMRERVKNPAASILVPSNSSAATAGNTKNANPAETSSTQVTMKKAFTAAHDS